MKPFGPFKSKLFLSFLGTLILSSVGLNFLLDQKAQWRNTGIYRAEQLDVFKVFPIEYLNFDVSDPLSAKKQHLFWSEAAEFVQAGAINGLNHAPLFEQLFPGFPASLATDKNLWPKYFKHEFNFDTYIPSIQETSSITFRALLSSDGCVDIFKQYGADILVYGSSETNRSLIPQYLSQSIQPDSHNSAVLLCVKHGENLKTMYATAEKLAATGQRSKIAIVGLSFWQLAIGFKLEPSKGWIHASLSDLFQKPAWSDWVRFSYSGYQHYLDEKSIWENKLISKKETSAETKNFFDPTAKGYVPFNKELLNSTSQLAQLMSTAIPYYSPLDGVSETQCDLTEAEINLKALVAKIKESADLVFIYLTPVTPLQINYAPTCLRPAVKKLLNSINEASVYTKTDDWDLYGLSWSDFALQTSVPQKMVIDVNHTNFNGAKKVTQSIARWITESRENQK